MDYVQLNQEEMVAELKDLRQKGVFTKEEIKQIVVKRTAFESALARRHPKKADYLRYVEYLMALEALRKKRVNRLKLYAAKESLADYCLIRAQFHTFERAARRFKDDVGLWVQYINLAKREKSNSLAGSIAARALQLHPTSVPLYILSASHQLSLGGTEAARTLLQRGIRLNPDSVQLWTEYARLEIEYIQQTKRELRKLQKEQKEIMEINEETAEELLPDIRVDVDMKPEVKDIVDGAIVKEVMRHAVEARPTMELFTSLRLMLCTYPSSIRTPLMTELYTLLTETLPYDPKSIRLRAIYPPDDLDEWEETSAIVDRLRKTNHTLIAGVKDNLVDKDEMGSVYAEWVAKWVETLHDENLRLYLTRSLHTVVSSLPSSRLSVSLAIADLRLCKSASTAKLLARGKKYLDIFPESAKLWLQYLELLSDQEDGSNEGLQAWQEARVNARGTVEDLVPIWIWGPRSTISGKGRTKMWKEILTASIQYPLSELHSHILLAHIDELYRANSTPTIASRFETVSKLVNTFLPSAACYRSICEHESAQAPSPADASRSILELVCERWRKIPGHAIEAAVSYAWWLVKVGDGKAAKDVVDRTKTTLGEEERELLDKRWMEALHGREAAIEEQEEMQLEWLP